MRSSTDLAFRPGSARGARARRCHGRRAAAPRPWNKSDCAPRRRARCTLCGTPRRTGTWNTSSASSIAPSILALPPVSTMPAAITSSKPLRAQLLAHQAEQLLVARLDDLGERLARQASRRALADARHLDALVGVGELRERAGVADLDVLGVLRRACASTRRCRWSPGRRRWGSRRCGGWRRWRTPQDRWCRRRCRPGTRRAPSRPR